jgi:hypothetical protein
MVTTSTVVIAAPAVMTTAPPVVMMFVPVSVSLPSSPVLSEVAITNAVIAWMMMTIIRGKTMEEPGYPAPFDEAPRAIIAPCPVPAALERTIPESLIKYNIHTRVRHCVCVSPGDNHQFRFSLKRIGREIDPYADAYSGRACRHPGQPKTEHQESGNEYDTCHLLHVKSSFSAKIGHPLSDNNAG